MLLIYSYSCINDETITTPSTQKPSTTTLRIGNYLNDINVFG